MIFKFKHLIHDLFVKFNLPNLNHLRSSCSRVTQPAWWQPMWPTWRCKEPFGERPRNVRMLIWDWDLRSPKMNLTTGWSVISVKWSPQIRTECTLAAHCAVHSQYGIDTVSMSIVRLKSWQAFTAIPAVASNWSRANFEQREVVLFPLALS